MHNLKSSIAMVIELSYFMKMKSLVILCFIPCDIFIHFLHALHVLHLEYP